jgi:peptidoglycan/LPS O-acetylase OafA/YrhL
MSLTELVLVFSLISGFMACMLIVFTLFFEKNKKKSRILLIWSVVFLAAHFTTMEYAFWLEGYNIVSFIPTTLIFYFASWALFLFWLFESRKERKIWIILLVLLAIGILIIATCETCNWKVEFPPRIYIKK